MADEKNINTENTENTQREGQGNVLAGFVLFKDANIDWLRFKKNLEDDWDITFDDEINNGAVVFSVDDMNVACSLLKLDNAIGIYKAPTVYEKDFYINFAMSIDKGECPVPIYVYVGLYAESDSIPWLS